MELGKSGEVSYAKSGEWRAGRDAGGGSCCTRLAAVKNQAVDSSLLCLGIGMRVMLALHGHKQQRKKMNLFHEVVPRFPTNYATFCEGIFYRSLHIGKYGSYSTRCSISTPTNVTQAKMGASPTPSVITTHPCSLVVLGNVLERLRGRVNDWTAGKIGKDVRNHRSEV